MKSHTDIVVVEIPHRFPAKVYETTKERILSAAHGKGGDYGYEVWNMKMLTECYGDEIPEKAKLIAQAEGEVGEVNGEWGKVADMGDEFEWAFDVLTYDNSSAGYFDNVYDALAHYYECRGHGVSHVLGLLEKMAGLDAREEETE